MNIDELIQNEEYKALFNTRYHNFGCGDGWTTRILHPLCEFINHKLDVGWPRVKAITFTFTQIKEKFGTLNAYYHIALNEDIVLDDNLKQHAKDNIEAIKGAVSFAEYLSSFTCEETGDIGEIVSVNGWYKTLSDEKISEKEKQGGKITKFEKE